MAKVNFKRISNSALIDNIDIEDGSFIVTGDGKAYVDYEEERIPICGTPDFEMNDESTNSVENKVIKKYIDKKVEFLTESTYEIEEYDDWIVKKYDNGLVEMYHKITTVKQITNQYAGPGGYIHWCLAGVYEYPIQLTELISIQSIAQAYDHLIGTSVYFVDEKKYNLYVYDQMKLPDQDVKLFTTIVGKWK